MRGCVNRSDKVLKFSFCECMIEEQRPEIWVPVIYLLIYHKVNNTRMVIRLFWFNLQTFHLVLNQEDWLYTFFSSALLLKNWTEIIIGTFRGTFFLDIFVYEIGIADEWISVDAEWMEISPFAAYMTALAACWVVETM